ncbi:MAG: winged helix-turn-helix transcriptional regulator [Thermoplasmata archaeon]|nr:MAG: winged helix-turn-helix transcriptional regulator [Thermoplasmata archaeon]
MVRDETKDHKTRRLICKYISSHPGVSLIHIRNIFDLNYSTLKYHLKYLERTRKITSKKVGRNRCFYIDNGFKTDEIPIQSAVINSLNANQQRILTLIQSNPGITKREINQHIRLNRKTLNYSLNKLIEKKLIWKVKGKETAGAPAETGYEYITPEKLHYEILNQLLIKLLENEIDEKTFHIIKKKMEAMEIDDIKI